MKTTIKIFIALFYFLTPLSAFPAVGWTIVGDGVPTGTAELVQDYGDHTIYRYIGKLSSQSFKVSDGTNNFVPLCGDNDPLEQTIDLRKEDDPSETGFRIHYVGEKDYFKVSVKEDGSTLQLLVEKAEAPQHVYLVGGPINNHDPNWLLEDAKELEKDTENPYVFRFKGMLRYNTFGDERGSIKFLNGLSWDPGYHPEGNADAPLLQSLKTITKIRVGGADNKWTIPEDGSGNGYYEITLNTLDETIMVDSFRYISEAYPEKIYITGAAMQCGWTNESPEEMTQTSGIDGVYSWTGTALQGEFKFLKSKGSWGSCYVATTPAESILFGHPHPIVYEVDYWSGGGNDYKFIMPEVCTCTIVVDMNTMTMTISKESEMEAIDLWITGSAIPSGIQKLTNDNINSATSYRYHGALLSGSFKIITTEDIDENTEYYLPVAVTDAISSEALMYKTRNNSIAGWIVSQPNDLYKLKFNVMSNKYKGEIHDVRALYIVGGATSIGWDATNAIALLQDEENSNVFTFTGELRINESGTERNQFKFLQERNFSSKSYHPATQNEPIMGSLYITENVSDDYRWTINENQQGQYIIKVNTVDETIEARFGNSAINSAQPEGDIELLVKRNVLLIMSNSDMEQNVSIFGIDGKIIIGKTFRGYTEIALPSAVYIVRIINNQTEVFTAKINISN